MNRYRRKFSTTTMTCCVLSVLLSGEGCGPPTTVTVLRFAATPKEAGHTFEDEQVVEAVNRKLNSGRNILGRAELVQGRWADDRLLLDVHVFGEGRADVDAVKQRLADFDLEFRILANPDDPAHQEIIKAARSTAEPPHEGNIVRTGDQAARWVNCPPLEDLVGTAVTNQVVPRTDANSDGEESVYALVLMDDFDVTGIQVESAWKDVDTAGRPAISIRFTRPGAARFSQLTGKNLRSETTGLRQRLAIVINNEVTSAPFIYSRIAEQAIIEGSFTEAEVEDVVARLDGGTLPVRLELVEERAP